MSKKTDVQMGFRVPSDLHQKCSDSAESMGITLAAWIRGAMIMRLDRESRAHPCGADGDGARATANGKPLPDAVEELFARINELEKRTGVTQNAGRDAKMSVKIGK